MTAKEDKKTPSRVGRVPGLILGQLWGRPSLAGGVLCVDSAEAAVPELSRLRKKNREIESQMRYIPRSEVPAYREYVKKVSPIIRNIFEEEDRIDRQGYYNSANLRALFIVAPTYSSSAKSAK